MPAPRPMLARLVRDLPDGDYLYEPKWDGFRCIAVRDGGAVELWSWHGRPLGRYFPELVTALARFGDVDRISGGSLSPVRVAGAFDDSVRRDPPAVTEAAERRRVDGALEPERE